MNTNATKLILFILLSLTVATVKYASGNQGRVAQPIIRQSQIGGEASDIAINGNMLFVVEGVRLVAYDLSDTTNPTQVGDLIPSTGQIIALLVDGNYAYVTTRNEMVIVDVSQPNAMTVTGRYTTTGGGDLDKSGDLVYLAAYFRHISPTETLPSALRIINVANPANPTEIASYETEFYGKLVFSNGYVYASSLRRGALGGIQTFDVSNPASIQLTNELGGEVSNFTVGNDVLFTRRYNANGSVFVYSLADPATPSFATVYDFIYSQDSGGFEVMDNVLWVADRDLLAALDVTDIDSPAGIGSVDQFPGKSADTAAAIAITPSLIATANSADGFQLLTPNVAILSTTPLPLSAVNVVEGNAWGIVAFDSEHQQLTLLQNINGVFTKKETVEHPNYAVDVTLNEQWLYLNQTQNIGIYEQTTDGQLIDRGSVDLVEDISQIRLIYADNKLFYVSVNDNLVSYDLSNPAMPVHDNTVPFEDALFYGFIRAEAVADGKLYSVADRRFVLITDISTGDTLGTLQLHTNEAENIYVVGNIAYVTTHNDSSQDQLADDYKLITVDVSDPQQPIRLDSDELPISYIQQVVSDGSSLYVASDAMGNGGFLTQFDLTDTTNPQETARFTMHGNSQGGSDVTLSNGTVVVADGDAGIWIGLTAIDLPYNLYLPVLID